jgi:hypothetical protein
LKAFRIVVAVLLSPLPAATETALIFSDNAFAIPPTGISPYQSELCAVANVRQADAIVATRMTEELLPGVVEKLSRNRELDPLLATPGVAK